MKNLFYHLLQVWLLWTLKGGYLAVFVLMAMESSIIPIPSEVVIPPAAYWASQGKMNFWFVVLIGTIGSWVGSSITYLVSRSVGRPFMIRYGKYFFVPEKRLTTSEIWLGRYSAIGIFTARLLPVLRHLISIPAGIIRMPFGTFSLMTIVGSFLWCLVLAWFGSEILGTRPDLLENPAGLVAACREKIYLILPAIGVFFVAYVLIIRIKKSKLKADSPSGVTEMNASSTPEKNFSTSKATPPSKSPLEPLSGD